MAIVTATQKMVVKHAGGETTIFPSAQRQSLPDHLLDHHFVKGAIASKWITVHAEPVKAVEKIVKEQPVPKVEVVQEVKESEPRKKTK